MNKEQYINALKENLSSLPEQEQNEAIGFYEEYLSDMEENNPGGINNLDEPSRVAAQIKAEAALRSTDTKGGKKKTGLATAWTVLLAVLALPIGLPVAIAIAAVAISLIIVALSLVISLFAIVLSVIVAAITSLISGIVLIFTAPAVGVFYLGCGLLGIGLGYMMLVGVYNLSKKLFIWIARLINKMRVRQQNKKMQKNEVA